MLIEHELFNLLRGFASLQSPKALDWPRGISVAKIHDFLLNAILLSPHFTSYPPSAQYRKGFWKWAVENLEQEISASPQEANEFEIDERIYKCYLGLLPPSESAAGSSNPLGRQQICGRGLPVHQHAPLDSYITHYWRSALHNPVKHDSYGTQELAHISHYQTITLFESRRMIQSGTTGLRTWRASFVLAHYLTQHTDMVAFKRVLELGCGVGFLGILVATLQTQQLTASNKDKHQGSLYLTDVHDDVLARCQDNIRLQCNSSSIHPDIHVQSLDWFASLDNSQRNVLASLLRDEIRPDVVLGADVVFDPSLIPALVGVLSLALLETSCSAKYALLALAIRNPATMDAFVAQAKEAGLQIAEIILDQRASSEQVHAPLEQENVYLFRVTAQSKYTSKFSQAL